ncbi:MAG: TolC family protein [Caulobacteraceae bacterium]
MDAGQPADAAPRGDWWRMFNDPVLDGLEARIEGGNPDLAAALARYDQARAYLAQARSALVPELDASGSATRNRQSEAKPLRVGGPNLYNNDTYGGTVSYEFDLWGRVRNSVAAGKAQAQASAADVASVRLSLEAQLADTYLGLRGLDAQSRLLADTVDAYTRALKLTEAHMRAGSSPASTSAGPRPSSRPPSPSSLTWPPSAPCSNTPSPAWSASRPRTFNPGHQRRAARAADGAGQRAVPAAATSARHRRGRAPGRRRQRRDRRGPRRLLPQHRPGRLRRPADRRRRREPAQRGQHLVDARAAGGARHLRRRPAQGRRGRRARPVQRGQRGLPLHRPGGVPGGRGQPRPLQPAGGRGARPGRRGWTPPSAPRPCR